MLRLGHIVYSNCFPVHARFIDQAPPEGVVLAQGVPSVLNDMLAHGDIDVAPCSSIEYARHAERYRLLPEVVIGSRGAVGSILLVGAPPAALDGAVVALTTSSATSVCLLKILLRVRWRVMPRFVWFDQGRHDPFAMGAAAALYIGDLALDPSRPGSGVVCRDGASICVRALADKRWFPGRASAIGVGPCRITGVLATASGRVGQTPREAFPARRAKP
jgi:predicted solute-binding protein